MFKMEISLLLAILMLMIIMCFQANVFAIEDSASPLPIWEEVKVLILLIIAFYVATVIGVYVGRKQQLPITILLPNYTNPICAIPRLENQLQKTFSLVPDIINPKYNVHIISCYEGDIHGPDSFPIHIGSETIRGCNISVDVEVEKPDSRPIILILASQRPVNWQLNIITPDVEIEQVELISYHQVKSEITHIGPSKVNKASIAREIPTGYGDDNMGGDTPAMMYYIMTKYGNISSFTGCHGASRWFLKLSGGKQVPMDRADIQYEDQHPSEKKDMDILESHLLYHEYLGGGASGEVNRVSWKTKYHGVMDAAAKKVRITEEQNFEEITREVEMLRKLNHPNVIKLFGTVRTRTHLVIVTEFASKGSLHAFLKKVDKLPDDLFQAWVLQSALGIQYSHKQNIVHCDIKPANFVISKDFVLKLCDLGIAMYLTHTTDTPAGRGTIKYLAPEVFRDNRRSPACDVYSYGFLVWALFTCKSPYEGWIPERVQWNVGYEHYRPEIPAECPNLIRNLIEVCWQEDYRLRPEVDDIVRSIEENQNIVEAVSSTGNRTLLLLDLLNYQDLMDERKVLFGWTRPTDRNLQPDPF